MPAAVLSLLQDRIGYSFFNFFTLKLLDSVYSIFSMEAELYSIPIEYNPAWRSGDMPKRLW